MFMTSPLLMADVFNAVLGMNQVKAKQARAER
jgi:hypothetical protein